MALSTTFRRMQFSTTQVGAFSKTLQLADYLTNGSARFTLRLSPSVSAPDPSQPCEFEIQLASAVRSATHTLTVQVVQGSVVTVDFLGELFFDRTYDDICSLVVSTKGTPPATLNTVLSLELECGPFFIISMTDPTQPGSVS